MKRAAQIFVSLIFIVWIFASVSLLQGRNELQQSLAYTEATAVAAATQEAHTLATQIELQETTVALQTTQQSSISSKEKGSLDFGSAKALTFPKTVIELLVPSQSQGNPTGPNKSLTLAKSLPGYSSFEEFWASTDPSIW